MLAFFGFAGRRYPRGTWTHRINVSSPSDSGSTPVVEPDSSTIMWRIGRGVGPSSSLVTGTEKSKAPRDGHSWLVYILPGTRVGHGPTGSECPRRWILGAWLPLLPWKHQDFWGRRYPRGTRIHRIGMPSSLSDLASAPTVEVPDSSTMSALCGSLSLPSWAKKLDIHFISTADQYDRTK